MMAKTSRLFARRRRRTRARLALRGRGRPRLSVFRSNRNIYAQIIDDGAGRTLAAASSVDRELRAAAGAPVRGGDVAAARAVGQLLAERAAKAGIGAVVFDRGGYLFHGRVRALAEAAREHGLSF